MRKWIDTPDVKRYEQFVVDWHYFLEDIQESVRGCPDEAKVKEKIMYILTTFYVQPYSGEQDFYEQFYVRLENVKKVSR